MTKPLDLKVVDTSGLTDADWSAINRVMCACELGGFEVFWDEIDKLMYPGLRIRVAMAFFPDLVSEALKDEMAQQGTTREDLKVLLRRLESPVANQ
jgi:hypothetical protein